MRKVVEKILQLAEHHRLVAFFLLAILLCAILLGLLHQMQIGGELLIVIVRHAKHQLHDLGNVYERLKTELTTWDEEPPGKKTADGSRKS